MKCIASTGAPKIHVPGWMGGCKSRFKDCLQQSKMDLFGIQITTVKSYFSLQGLIFIHVRSVPFFTLNTHRTVVWHVERSQILKLEF
jgi:hypothetical protein